VAFPKTVTESLEFFSFFGQYRLNLFLCFCNALSKDEVRGAASVVRRGIFSRLKIVMYSGNITGQELEFDYIRREKILKR